MSAVSGLEYLEAVRFGDHREDMRNDELRAASKGHEVEH